MRQQGNIVHLDFDHSNDACEIQVKVCGVIHERNISGDTSGDPPVTVSISGVSHSIGDSFTSIFNAIATKLELIFEEGQYEIRIRSWRRGECSEYTSAQVIVICAPSLKPAPSEGKLQQDTPLATAKLHFIPQLSRQTMLISLAVAFLSLLVALAALR